MSRYTYNASLVNDAINSLGLAGKSLMDTGSTIAKGANTICSARGADLLEIDFSVVSSYDAQVLEYIDTMSTEIKSKAQEIEEYEQAPFYKKIFSSIGLTALKLVEGLGGFVESLGDGVVSLAGAAGGLFNEDFKNSCAEFVKKDIVGDAFSDAYENGWLKNVNKYSYFSHTSTAANVFKGFGTAAGYIGVSLLTGGSSLAVELGVEGSIAAAAGLGTGVQENLQAGETFDSAFKKGMKTATIAAAGEVAMGLAFNKLLSPLIISQGLDEVAVVTKVTSKTKPTLGIGKKAKKLLGSTEEIVDGSGDIIKATDKVSDGGRQLLKGSEGIAEESGKVLKHADTANDTGRQLLKGSNEVADNGKQIVKTTNEAIEGSSDVLRQTDKVSDTGRQIVKNSNEVVDGSKQIVKTTNNAIESGSDVLRQTDKVSDTGRQIVKNSNEAVDSSKQMVKATNNTMESGNDVLRLTDKSNSSGSALKAADNSAQQPNISKRVVNQTSENSNQVLRLTDKSSAGNTTLRVANNSSNEMVTGVKAAGQGVDNSNQVLKLTDNITSTSKELPSVNVGKHTNQTGLNGVLDGPHNNLSNQLAGSLSEINPSAVNHGNSVLNLGTSSLSGMSNIPVSTALRVVDDINVGTAIRQMDNLPVNSMGKALDNMPNTSISKVTKGVDNLTTAGNKVDNVTAIAKQGDIPVEPKLPTKSIDDLVENAPGTTKEKVKYVNSLIEDGTIKTQDDFLKFFGDNESIAKRDYTAYLDGHGGGGEVRRIMKNLGENGGMPKPGVLDDIASTGSNVDDITAIAKQGDSDLSKLGTKVPDTNPSSFDELRTDLNKALSDRYGVEKSIDEVTIGDHHYNSTKYGEEIAKKMDAYNEQFAKKLRLNSTTEVSNGMSNLGVLDDIASTGTNVDDITAIAKQGDIPVEPKLPTKSIDDLVENAPGTTKEKVKYVNSLIEDGSIKTQDDFLKFFGDNESIAKRDYTAYLDGHGGGGEVRRIMKNLGENGGMPKPGVLDDIASTGNKVDNVTDIAKQGDISVEPTVTPKSTTERFSQYTTVQPTKHDEFVSRLANKVDPNGEYTILNTGKGNSCFIDKNGNAIAEITSQGDDIVIRDYANKKSYFVNSNGTKVADEIIDPETYFKSASQKNIVPTGTKVDNVTDFPKLGDNNLSKLSTKVPDTTPSSFDELRTDLNKALSDRYGVEKSIDEVTIGDHHYNSTKYGEEIAKKMDAYNEQFAKKLRLNSTTEVSNGMSNLGVLDDIASTGSSVDDITAIAKQGDVSVDPTVTPKSTTEVSGQITKTRSSSQLSSDMNRIGEGLENRRIDLDESKAALDDYRTKNKIDINDNTRVISSEEKTLINKVKRSQDAYDKQYNKLLDKQKQYSDVVANDPGRVGTEGHYKIINNSDGGFETGRPALTDARAKVEGQIDGSALKKTPKVESDISRTSQTSKVRVEGSEVKATSRTSGHLKGDMERISEGLENRRIDLDESKASLDDYRTKNKIDVNDNTRVISPEEESLINKVKTKQTAYDEQYNKLLDKQKQYTDAVKNDPGSVGTEGHYKIINNSDGGFETGRPALTDASAKVEGQIDGSAFKNMPNDPEVSLKHPSDNTALSVVDNKQTGLSILDEQSSRIPTLDNNTTAISTDVRQQFTTGPSSRHDEFVGTIANKIDPNGECVIVKTSSGNSCFIDKNGNAIAEISTNGDNVVIRDYINKKSDFANPNGSGMADEIIDPEAYFRASTRNDVVGGVGNSTGDIVDNRVTVYDQNASYKDVSNNTSLITKTNDETSSIVTKMDDGKTSTPVLDGDNPKVDPKVDPKVSTSMDDAAKKPNTIFGKVKNTIKKHPVATAGVGVGVIGGSQLLNSNNSAVPPVETGTTPTPGPTPNPEPTPTPTPGVVPNENSGGSGGNTPVAIGGGGNNLANASTGYNPTGGSGNSNSGQGNTTNTTPIPTPKPDPLPEQPTPKPDTPGETPTDGGSQPPADGTTPPTGGNNNQGTGNGGTNTRPSGGGSYGNGGYIGEKDNPVDPNANKSIVTNDETISDSLSELIGNDEYVDVPTSSTPISNTSNVNSKKSSIPIIAGLSSAAIAGIGAKAYLDKKEQEESEEDLETDTWENEEQLEVDYSEGNTSTEERDYLDPTDEYAYQEEPVETYQAVNSSENPSIV